jgi:hypothetical protein
MTAHSIQEGYGDMSRKIVQYHVIFARKLDDFNNAVNANVVNGWQPLGELHLAPGAEGGGVIGYFQVIVRYADDEPQANKSS